MRKIKVIFAGLLCLAVLFSTGCNRDSVKPIDPPEDTLTEDVALMFNNAVQHLEDAESYTMTGSVSSSSVMGEVLTSVVNSIHCTYEIKDGAGVMLMQTEQRYDGKVFPHSTYVADGKYYISAADSNYVVSTNDFDDYDALSYAKRIEDTAISNCQILSNADGKSQQLRFEIPYGVYYSEALDGWFGALVDDSLLQRPVTVRADIDENGKLILLYISVENSTDFDGTDIEQSVVLSLSFSGYDATQVAAPENLADYEDRTENGSGGLSQGEIDPSVEFTGDSLD